ncbi:MAG TPA: alpha/beta fold hydrolase [Rubrivivax sp.]|nr:alpha/beta fold hydrolase [Rubrivivax sp.]
MPGGRAHRFLLRRLRAPRLAHGRTPADLGLAAQSLRLRAAGGKSLFAWFVPAPGEAPAPAVLLMHGWGANAALMLPAVPPLHAAGFAVLLTDARCHGASDDEEFSSMPRFAEDIAAGLDWLCLHPAVDAARLAVAGHSVGAAAALLAATQREDIRAVVSLSAFAHPVELMRRWLHEQHLPWWPLGWAVARHVQRVIGARFDDIAPLATLPRLRCPVLLVHGRHDETVPYGDAERLLFASGGRAELLQVQGGHDLGDALGPYAAAIVGFVRRALAGP